MQTTKNSSIAKSVGAVMVLTLISRVFALVQNQYYLSYFGAGDINLNIYSYAVSVPNILFNSLGTALSTVVIPIYASLLALGKRKEADYFASCVITVASAIIAGLVFIGIAISPLLAKMTEFSNSPEQFRYAVLCLSALMPVMLFYGASYIYQGILQSHQRPIMPAIMGIPGSVLTICYIAFFGRTFGVTGLLCATIFALFLQAAVLIFPAKRVGFSLKPSFDLKNEHLRRAGRLVIPILVGSGAFQINMLYNVTLMANFKGFVTLLTFVQNLIISSVLAIVLSVTAVIYPKMTKELAVGDTEGFKNTFNTATNWLIFFFVPLSVGMIVMAKPLLWLISGYGKMTVGDINSAAKILSLYSVCLVALCLKELCDRAFYAAKNTKIPAICGFITVGVNIALSQIFIRFAGPYGIPLAYSCACVSAFGFLALKLRKAQGVFNRQTLETLIKSALASAAMAVVLLRSMRFFEPSTGIISRISVVAVPFILGVATYFALAFLLKTSILVGIKAKKGTK